MIVHVAIALFLPAAHGLNDAYPEQVFRSEGLARVQISGVRGRVTLKGEAKGAYRLRVRHSILPRDGGWGLLVERRGDTLVLEVYNVAYGREWQKILHRNQWPAFDIDLQGPPKPVVIGWREGDVRLDHWRADLDVSVVRGNLTLNGGAGRARLQTARGDVTIRNFNGDLNVRGEDGRLDLAAVNGTCQLNWLSGRAYLARVRGALTLDSVRAEVTAEHLDGRINLGVAEGRANVDGVGPRLSARGRGTDWWVRPRRGAKVMVRSEGGAVDVVRAGVLDVLVSTRLGEITGVPGAMEVRAGRRFARGSWGSGSSRGRVLVRTDRGRVRVTE